MYIYHNCDLLIQPAPPVHPQTWRLLTSEPAIPPASKRDRRLYRGGFYSSKYSKHFDLS